MNANSRIYTSEHARTTGKGAYTLPSGTQQCGGQRRQYWQAKTTTNVSAYSENSNKWVRDTTEDPEMLQKSNHMVQTIPRLVSNKAKLL